MWCDKPDYNRQATIYEIVALQTEQLGHLNKKAGKQTQPNLYGMKDVGSLREEQDAHPIWEWTKYGLKIRLFNQRYKQEKITREYKKELIFSAKHSYQVGWNAFF